MEEIDKELSEKSIEKSDNVEIKITPEDVAEPQGSQGVEPPPPKKRTKKQRSQKQIESFEKARKIRAEKIAAKKKEKDDVKEEKKVKIKEFKQTLEQPQPRQSEVSHYDPGHHPMVPGHQKEQIVNNYFYYAPPPGVPMGNPHAPAPAAPGGAEAPPRQATPSESSEEEYYEEEPFIEQPKLQFQYNYV